MPGAGPSARDLVGRIRRGEIAPIYVLSGPERHLRETVVAALRATVVGSGPDLGVDLLTAKEAGARGILAAARTLPMLAARRFVLVRDVEGLNAKDLDALLPYARQPNPSTCLVMTGEKVDQRYKFFSAVAKSGVLARFETPPARQLPAWVRHEARDLGVDIEDQASALLVEAIGRDLGELRAALERLALYVDDGDVRATIRSIHVEEAVIFTRSHSVFELTDAVGKRDTSTALTVLRRMIADRQNAHGILAMLARHLRQVWAVREMRGTSAAAIASDVGVPPFVATKLLDQAGRFPEDALQRAHRALADADRRLKSSRLPDGPILERLILEMTRGEAALRPRGSQRS